MCIHCEDEEDQRAEWENKNPCIIVLKIKPRNMIVSNVFSISYCNSLEYDFLKVFEVVSLTKRRFKIIWTHVPTTYLDRAL